MGIFARSNGPVVTFISPIFVGAANLYTTDTHVHFCQDLRHPSVKVQLTSADKIPMYRLCFDHRLGRIETFL